MRIVQNNPKFLINLFLQSAATRAFALVRVYSIVSCVWAVGCGGLLRVSAEGGGLCGVCIVVSLCVCCGSAPFTNTLTHTNTHRRDECFNKETPARAPKAPNTFAQSYHKAFRYGWWLCGVECALCASCVDVDLCAIPTITRNASPVIVTHNQSSSSNHHRHSTQITE